MKSKLTAKVVKVASFLAVGGALAAASSTAATSMSACGESGACTNLRQDTYLELEAWQTCDPAGPSDQCIIEPGNPKDCTGVLTCAFAVNPKYRAEAEQTMYTIGQASQGCYLCAVPNCITANLGYCEPVSRRCIGATALSDSGAFVIVTPPEDSGAPPPVDSGPPPTSDAGDATVL